MEEYVQRLAGIGLWRFIRKGWGKFYDHIIFEKEDGSKIRFDVEIESLRKSSQFYIVLLVLMMILCYLVSSDTRLGYCFQ